VWHQSAHLGAASLLNYRLRHCLCTIQCRIHLRCPIYSSCCFSVEFFDCAEDRSSSTYNCSITNAISKCSLCVGGINQVSLSLFHNTTLGLLTIYKSRSPSRYSLRYSFQDPCTSHARPHPWCNSHPTVVVHRLLLCI
jgi:hypothetical protein